MAHNRAGAAGTSGALSEFVLVCMYVCMYVCICMYACMYVCNGFTIEIYGFMHSLHTFWHVLLRMPSHN